MSRPVVKDKIQPRSIGFTDAEWSEIKTTARSVGLAPSTFVRYNILRVIRGGPKKTAKK